jgi:hypothetical protein
VNTGGMADADGAADTIATNVARLSDRMTGSALAPAVSTLDKLWHAHEE